MKSELTGRKVFIITASAFAVIIGVNVLMAVQAVRTFPGLEVRNSYVASQNFDADRKAQEALGWVVEHEYADGRLRIGFRDRDGRPVEVSRMSALIGRTTVSASDQRPEFRWNGTGYEAAADLAFGKWMIHLEAYAEDGTRFYQRIDMFVRG